MAADSRKRTHFGLSQLERTSGKMICRFAIVFLSVVQMATAAFGGYNGLFLADGLGLKKALSADAPVDADAKWSIYCWIRPAEPFPERTLIAGIGEPGDPGQRYFAIVDGDFSWWAGPQQILRSHTRVQPAGWHLLAATFDGATAALYFDGVQTAQNAMTFASAGRVLEMAPTTSPWPDGGHFAGKVADLTLLSRALSDSEIHHIYSNPPPFDLLEFEEGSKPWPVQTRAQAGYRAPQSPDTMPKSSVPPSRPQAHPPAYTGPVLAKHDSHEWVLAGDWRLASQ